MKGSRFNLPPLKLPAGLTSEEIDEAMESEAARNLHCFKIGLVAALGHELGGAVHEIVTGKADKPNGELAPSYTRAAVSRAACRVRRHLGLSIECPNKARAGRKAKAQEVKP